MTERVKVIILIIFYHKIDKMKLIKFIITN